MNSKKTRVAICTPILDKIDPLFMQSYLTLDREGIEWNWLQCKGQLVDDARNGLTEQALADPDVTHIMWIDSDMVFPPDSIKRLLAHDKPIVGGLCHDRRHPYKPVIARYLDPSWGMDGGTYGWLFDYPENEVIEVDATGGAFLLVRREVFEAIRENEGGPVAGAKSLSREKIDTYRSWWTPIAEHHGRSEDLAFCWRAKAAGYSIFVDTSLDIGHVGEVVVNKAFSKRNREFEYNEWQPPLDDSLRIREKSDPLVEPIVDPKRKNLASIIITAYNPKPEMLIAAVKSALAQSVPCEVIVVDDGSNRCIWCGGPRHHSPGAGLLSNEEIPKGVAQLITHAKNGGIAEALNTGIASMQTDWFCWLPCDDLFHPRKVEFQLAALLDANALAGYHGYDLKLDNRNQLAHIPTRIFGSIEYQNDVLAEYCAINGTTVMIHRSILEQVGSFNESLRYAQDWEYWRRVGFVTRWHGMPDKLATRRDFGNLTEKLLKTKDKRKLEEDRIVREMKGPTR